VIVVSKTTPTAFGTRTVTECLESGFPLYNTLNKFGVHPLVSEMILSALSSYPTPLETATIKVGKSIVKIQVKEEGKKCR
jgi:hypothetical protein